ncbi:MAG: ArsR family transcriptional regulator [Desulfitibacter sp. BRH_c19]|nr:MAG: ArsR family transcriptional regulator [Desulfitibacter sp. BRH_c19]
MELVQIIKALADETRLRILNLLNQEKLCVCEIEYLLEINQSNASRHLNKLWMLKLITNEKKAQWVYYKINQDILKKHAFIKEILGKDFNKEVQFIKDNEKLKDYKKSGLNCESIKEMMCSKSATQ